MKIKITDARMPEGYYVAQLKRIAEEEGIEDPEVTIDRREPGRRDSKVETRSWGFELITEIGAVAQDAGDVFVMAFSAKAGADFYDKVKSRFKTEIEDKNEGKIED